MKLFVSDLDGTLLNSDFQISDANVRMIQKLLDQDVIFAVATGRIFHDAMTICANKRLKPYVIASNGACMFDQDGNYIYGQWIAYSELEKLVSYLKSLRVCFGVGSSEEYLTFPGWSKVLDQEITNLAEQNILVPLPSVEFAKYETRAQNGFCEMDFENKIKNVDIKAYSVSVVSYDEKKINKIVRYMEQLDSLTATIAGSHSLEIMRLDGTKGNAVQYLAERLDIKRCDVTAIGDSLNDISMLKYAGVSIAMGNARDEVKGICTHVTQDCAVDGFAQAVKRYLETI